MACCCHQCRVGGVLLPSVQSWWRVVAISAEFVALFTCRECEDAMTFRRFTLFLRNTFVYLKAKLVLMGNVYPIHVHCIYVGEPQDDQNYL